QLFLPSPVAAIRADGGELSLPEAAAVAVAAESTVTGCHDRAWLIFGPLSPWLAVNTESFVEIALGPGPGDLQPVFTGEVQRVGNGSWGTGVTLLASSAALDRV